MWVAVHYAIASSGGHRLDAIWSDGATLPIQLGARMVLSGWDLGMRGMRVGGRREIVIPPALGYGAAGHRPDVKPGETLVVVVDLLSASTTNPMAPPRASTGGPPLSAAAG